MQKILVFFLLTITLANCHYKYDIQNSFNKNKATRDFQMIIPYTGNQQVRIGNLYDARSGTFFSGFNLWSRNTLQKYVNTGPLSTQNSMVEIIRNRDEYFEKLHISASIRMNFLGGLVRASGSASYLEQQKRFSDSAKVIASQDSLNKYEVLEGEPLRNIDFEVNPILRDRATHVVIEIHYGGSAVFSHERRVRENENEREISGRLRLLMRNLPGMTMSGSGRLNMTRNQRSFSEQILTELKGNLQTGIDVSTMEGVWRVLKEFKNLNSVNLPKLFIAVPLIAVGSSVNNIYHRIQNMVMAEVTNKMNQLELFNSQLRTELEAPVISQFNQQRNALQIFNRQFNPHRRDFIYELGKKIIEVRSQPNRSLELLRIIKKYEEFPDLPYTYISQFLRNRNIERMRLDNYKNQFDARNIEYVSSVSSIQPTNELKLCLSFHHISYKPRQNSHWVPTENNQSQRIFVFIRDFIEMTKYKKYKLYYTDATMGLDNNKINLSLQGLVEGTTLRLGYQYLRVRLSNNLVVGAGDASKLMDYEFLFSPNLAYFVRVQKQAPNTWEIVRAEDNVVTFRWPQISHYPGRKYLNLDDGSGGTRLVLRRVNIGGGQVVEGVCGGRGGILRLQNNGRLEIYLPRERRVCNNWPRSKRVSDVIEELVELS